MRVNLIHTKEPTAGVEKCQRWLIKLGELEVVEGDGPRNAFEGKVRLATWVSRSPLDGR